MKLEKYRKIDTAARLWSVATEKSKRKQFQKYNDLVAGEFKRERRLGTASAPKNYTYIVVQTKFNRGTSKRPEVYNAVMTIHKNRVCNVLDDGTLVIDNDTERIKSDDVIGYISV